MNTATFDKFELQEHTRQAWEAKLRDNSFQGDSMKWPDLQEVSEVFRNLESLPKEIDRLNSDLERFE